ncbi:LuxR C-terminal-related transcriptional regulator [Streptomyces sp. NPDC054861]
MSTQHHAHVLVADDSPARALGVVRIVEELSYVARVSTSSVAGVADAVSRTAPDLVLLGLADAPEEELTTFVLTRPGGRVVRFITFGRPARITPSSVSAGLHGFLPSSATPQDFDRALSAALAGFTYFPRAMTAKLAEFREHFPQLTPREQQVLDLLSGGLSNHRIARSLGIKEATVKMYVTRVLAKLDVESRLQACLKARGIASAA